MNRFLKTIFKYFIVPAIELVMLAIFWDPFKIFFKYSDYYGPNRLAINRENACFVMLERSGPKNKHNFIIGSSRSQAFKTHIWAGYIGCSEQSCFHYDGNGMGLYRTTNAVKYLSKECEIKNLLLLMDTDFFEETTNPPGPLYIQSPWLSNESPIPYYYKFITASLDPRFIGCNMFYTATGKYYDFMGDYIRKSKFCNESENGTGDLYYANDQEIMSDSIGYYASLIKRNVFYDRKKSQDTSSILITEKHKLLLNQIASTIETQKISVKIIISPLYNQLKMNPADVQYLKKLFGEANVSDFSGINQYTSDPLNYYESSHFKPYIATQLMHEVYANPPANNIAPLAKN